MQPRTVLIVEDNPLTSKAFRLALEQGGIRVLEAHDADTALTVATSARPDLLILDHVLPGARGLDLLALVRDRTHNPGLPALLVTGTSTAAERRGAGADSNVAVMIKPVEPSSLLLAVQERLERADAADLIAARNELAALSHRLVHAQEEERRVLARELHDELGQSLTSIKITLETSLKENRPPDVPALRDEVDRLLTRVRALSLDLRPLMLDEVGLAPALAWHIERFHKQTGIGVDFEHAGLPQHFSPDIEIAAFRIIQEALTNVARHAGVRAARVHLEADERELRIAIEDDGRGFDPRGRQQTGANGEISPREPAIGLAGMRERAQLNGGRLEIVSSPGQGTRIRATLPRVHKAAGPGARRKENRP
jgi:signal transduction histidine kinase